MMRASRRRRFFLNSSFVCHATSQYVLRVADTRMHVGCCLGGLTIQTRSIGSFIFVVLFFSDDLDNILNTHTEASCMAANRKRAGGQTKEIPRPGENMKRTTTEAGAATTKKGQNCGRLRVREKRRNRSISRNDEAEKCV